MGFKLLRQGDRVAFTRHVLLQNDYPIRARHRCAGEDTHGLARSRRAVIGATCGGLALDGERRAGQVVGHVDPVAIHRRAREGRLRQLRRGGLRHDAAKGVAQAHAFGAQRLDQCQNLFQRLFDGQQAHDALPSASYFPDFPPSFSTTRIPSICMDFSTALSMS